MSDRKCIQEEIIQEAGYFRWIGIADIDRVRLDVYLSDQLEGVGLTRSFIQNQIKKGCALVNEIKQKPNYQVRFNDKITFIWPIPTTYEVEPENIPIDIIYQDLDIVVINKSKGMVVHPAPGHMSGTLIHALLFHIADLEVDGGMRPGIVHRIDKDTSGLLVIAKNDRAQEKLSQQIKTKEMGRVYVAIIRGYLPEPIRIDAPIGRSFKDRKKMAVIDDGREAATNAETLETYRGYSLVRCSLETGRTHQIRVHLSYINHSVLGDDVYGSSKNNFGLQGQALHAYELHLQQPSTDKQMTFQAIPPDDFLKVIAKLRKEADLPVINEQLGW